MKGKDEKASRRRRGEARRPAKRRGEERPFSAEPHSALLSSAPNWYCQRTCAWSPVDRGRRRGGLLALACRDKVALRRIASDTTARGRERSYSQSNRARRVYERFSCEGELRGHSGRVVAVCFYESPDLLHVCVSASEDGDARVWDTTARRCVAKIPKRPANVSCLAISPSNTFPHVVCGHKNSRALTIWRRSRDASSVSTMALEEEEEEEEEDGGGVVALSSIRSALGSNRAVVVAGCSRGRLFVVSVTSARALRVIRNAHERAVHHVAWFPVDTSSLFASSSADGTIALWDARRWRRLRRFELPGRRRTKEARGSHRGERTCRLWCTFAWIRAIAYLDADGLVRRGPAVLCGGYEGELIRFAWTRDCDERVRHVTRCVVEEEEEEEEAVAKDGGRSDRGHSRPIFSVVAERVRWGDGGSGGKEKEAGDDGSGGEREGGDGDASRKTRDDDDNDDDATTTTRRVLTVSMDRTLRIRRVGASVVASKASVHGLLGGFAYDVDLVATSPYALASSGPLSSAADFPSVAIVAGDGAMRVLDRESPSSSPLSVVWDGLAKTRVTAVRCHPTNASLVACGTHRGTIHVYVVGDEGADDGDGRRHRPFRSKHAGPVRQIEWYLRSSSSSSSSLFTRGEDGAVFELDAMFPSVERVSIDERVGAASACTAFDVTRASRGGVASSSSSSSSSSSYPLFAIASASFASSSASNACATTPPSTPSASHVRVLACRGDDVDRAREWRFPLSEYAARARCNVVKWRPDASVSARGKTEGTSELACAIGDVVWIVRLSSSLHDRATTTTTTLLSRSSDGHEDAVRLCGHDDAILDLAWRRDASSDSWSTLLTASADRTVRLWRVARTSVDALRRFCGHGGSVLSVTWWPERDAALTASADHTVRVWDIAIGAEAGGGEEKKAEGSGETRRRTEGTAGARKAGHGARAAPHVRDA